MILLETQLPYSGFAAIWMLIYFSSNFYEANVGIYNFQVERRLEQKA